MLVRWWLQRGSNLMWVSSLPRFSSSQFWWGQFSRSCLLIVSAAIKNQPKIHSAISLETQNSELGLNKALVSCCRPDKSIIFNCEPNNSHSRHLCEPKPNKSVSFERKVRCKLISHFTTPLHCSWCWLSILTRRDCALIASCFSKSHFNCEAPLLCGLLS